MHCSNIANICSDLIVFIRRFSQINLAAGVYWALGGAPRRVLNWKAIAIHCDFLLSKVIIDSFDSSESDDRTIVASSESDGRDCSEVNVDIELFTVNSG